ncbi:hypothetical protein NDU88_004476 [Pleurodeles waltl]|uniref:Uncharacterized protein n=1 Tax=Pleurodeles waltl TaxID=8319 RepID=A0AAV7SJ21_PLEWA|nr:hypothetical protein NDU88_004476 [Pleurodeles waltl]
MVVCTCRSQAPRERRAGNWSGDPRGSLPRAAGAPAQGRRPMWPPLGVSCWRAEGYGTEEEMLLVRITGGQPRSNEHVLAKQT